MPQHCLKTTVLPARLYFFWFLQLTERTPWVKNLRDSGGGSFSSAGSPIPTSLANRCPNHLSFFSSFFRQLPVSQSPSEPLQIAVGEPRNPARNFTAVQPVKSFQQSPIPGRTESKSERHHVNHISTF